MAGRQIDGIVCGGVLTMIEGARYWNDRTHYYIQTNNPTEQALKTYGKGVWLVSCGPTAAINCIAALGADVTVRSPSGKWAFQPEECLLDFMLDPRNEPKLNAIRNLDASISNQEVPQYYPYAVNMLFGVTSRFLFTDKFQTIAAHIKGHGTAQICLKSPGHYLAAVAIEEERGELIYNDSWPQRHSDSNGFHRVMTKKEYEEECQPYVILYEPLR